MFKKTKVCAGVLLAIGGLSAATAIAQEAQQLERVEVTGSRIKRAEAEGALPVTVITREELASSGAVSVAEFMRSSTFSSAGNFRPQSGSSAQSFAGVDLRGLGSARTLVLLDGRRLPKAPQVGDSADLNTIPMAAIERVEILTDGASAIYGSDAIGGVVNFITRKDFEGIDLQVGHTDPENDGGERNDASMLFGFTGEKGRVLMGASREKRGMVYTRQRPWGTALGVSSFGNNYLHPTLGFVSLGLLNGGTNPATGCTDPNFYVSGNLCSYNFNAVAADEAQIEQQSIFARTSYRIGKDWTAYANVSATNTESFGRYAPTPAQLTVRANTPNNPTASNITVRHRTAAAGNRDTNTDNTLTDMLLGFQGNITDNIELDVGMNYSRSKYKELGRNYIVRPILEQYVNDGTYDLYNPNANPADVLSAIKATIGRDSLFTKKEAYAIASMYDLFKLPGGSVGAVVGIEHRTEKYADIYDSLSEAGVIEGSAGNSAAGSREVASAFAEMNFPIMKGLEASLAGRFEKYSDYGSDFAPKASISYQPIRSLKLRAAAGEGFRAPSLPILTQKETFSAESVFDPYTCRAFGGQGSNPAYGPVTTGLTAANDCDVGRLVQVDSYTGSNPSLKSEKSKQWSAGIVFDATEWLSFTLDYANLKIDDTITLIGAQDLIDRTNGGSTLPIPAGLYVNRFNGSPTGYITRVQQGYANEGTVEAEYLDLSMVARHKYAGIGAFDHRLNVSNVLAYKINDAEQKGTLGLPKIRARLDNGWKLGSFGATWVVNYIGKNGTAVGRTAKEYVTHDLQFTYETPWKGTLTAGLTNVEGKMPQLIAYDGRNFNFYLYDSYGRQPYVRYNQKF